MPARGAGMLRERFGKLQPSLCQRARAAAALLGARFAVLALAFLTLGSSGNSTSFV